MALSTKAYSAKTHVRPVCILISKRHIGTMICKQKSKKYRMIWYGTSKRDFNIIIRKWNVNSTTCQEQLINEIVSLEHLQRWILFLRASFYWFLNISECVQLVKCIIIYYIDGWLDWWGGCRTIGDYIDARERLIASWPLNVLTHISWSRQQTSLIYSNKTYPSKCCFE